MKNKIKGILMVMCIMIVALACSKDDDSSENATPTTTPTTGSLHAAFGEFDVDNTDIYLDGSQVVIETNGLPNHNTVYWGQGHPLYVDATVATGLTPSRIPNYDGAATLRVPISPELASSSSATNMGAIGISISGAAIFNDQEGSGPLSSAIVSLDYTGGHIGPAEYHYHLEPKAWSDDDENLIGIIADGFFLYGRKCNSTGAYPTDLDASGGHVSTTQHTDEEEYHYHIVNELYVNAYYILFAGDYQGTPNGIN